MSMVPDAHMDPPWFYEDDGYEEDHKERIARELRQDARWEEEVDKRLEEQELEGFENIIEEVEYL